MLIEIAYVSTGMVLAPVKAVFRVMSLTVLNGLSEFIKNDSLSFFHATIYY